MEKPPLGLKPKFIVDEERIFEIICVINTYLSHKKPIPIKWIEEYNEYLEEKEKI